jgi:antitoxin ParD1/3/4
LLRGADELPNTRPKVYDCKVYDCFLYNGEIDALEICVHELATEEFVRQKVAVGDYETASEVVREALRLLKQRDEVWKAEVRSKIKEGIDSIRAGRAVSAQQVKAEMAAFKRKWKKDRSPK